MIRAVLDANVVLSAVLRPEGPPGRLIEAYLHDGAFEMVLSPEVVAEMERAFRYPKIRRRIGDEVGQALIVDFLLLADLVADGPTPGISRDPGDDKYVAAAIEGRADYIVTGDDDLLSLRQYEGVTILTPREFLGVLGMRGP